MNEEPCGGGLVSQSHQSRRSISFTQSFTCHILTTPPPSPATISKTMNPLPQSNGSMAPSPPTVIPRMGHDILIDFPSFYPGNMWLQTLVYNYASQFDMLTPGVHDILQAVVASCTFQGRRFLEMQTPPSMTMTTTMMDVGGQEAPAWHEVPLVRALKHINDILSPVVMSRILALRIQQAERTSIAPALLSLQKTTENPVAEAPLSNDQNDDAEKDCSQSDGEKCDAEKGCSHSDDANASTHDSSMAVDDDEPSSTSTIHHQVVPEEAQSKEPDGDLPYKRSLPNQFDDADGGGDNALELQATKVVSYDEGEVDMSSNDGAE